MLESHIVMLFQFPVAFLSIVRVSDCLTVAAHHLRLAGLGWESLILEVKFCTPWFGGDDPDSVLSS